MEDINCIFCGRASERVAIRENGYCGRQCETCGLIYVSPRPGAAEVSALYGTDEAHVSAREQLNAETLKRIHARHHLEIIKRHVPRGTLLEIGAGAGFFLDEARTAGFEPHAIELNHAQAGYIRKVHEIPCEEKPLGEGAFNGREFDIMFHCDVISHLPDPLTEFRNMNAALRSRGVLVFETGNLGEVDPRYYRLFSRFQYPDHLFFFTVQNLVDLLSRTGFDVVEIYRYSLVPQLSFNRAVTWVRKTLRGGRAASDRNPAAPSGGGDELPVKPNERPAGLRRRVRERLNAFLRYGVGRVAPLPRRPQTVLVIARKAT
ncbi:MAG: class I SAM-dependent methyltransferase [Gammaproteobacteria bacterium]